MMTEYPLIEPLRILFIEDSETDFKLVVRWLKNGLLRGEYGRVEDADGLRDALARAGWDAVISDWSLPRFDALSALQLLREMRLDLPFIILSGTVGEEAAVGAMRAGAHDYVLKNNLARLLPVLNRELREAKGRRARRETERALVDRTAKLASINEDLERSQDSLRQAIVTRDEFLSVASHELSTPLTSLKLQIQNLIRNDHAPAIAEQLKRIDRQADRLTKLIRQLLDVSRIAGNRLRLEPEDMDLGALVEEIVSRFALDLKHSGSELRVHAGIEIRGLWDRDRIDQVITNLISNAIKFGLGNPIDVILEPIEGGVRLSVHDGGIGIDSKSWDRIFERFERAVSTRHFGGLGIGLWIVRQIVEASGGTISVHSEIGRGSTFIVELPSTPRASVPAEITQSQETLVGIADDKDDYVATG
jgi:signal transduction histidine kinase